ncbi:hypothetical protein PMAYCL1PPCAC_23773, partial [Pristionchus mayeri]
TLPFIALIPILFYIYLIIPIYINPPNIDKDSFFGSGEAHKDDETVYPYLIDLSTQVREMRRMAQESINEVDEGTFERRIWSFLSDFNWDSHAHFINSFPHYKTQIEGLSIHFIHTEIKHQEKVKVIPILLLPASFSGFWSFIKILPILSNPSRYGFDFGIRDTLVFNVVIPSYPMSLFSDSPSNQTKVDNLSVSRIINKLMTDRLSYSKFFIFGDGGIGSEIASTISTLYPSSVSGLIIRDPTATVQGIRNTLQLYFLRSDSIETKMPLPTHFPRIEDESFAVSLRYIIDRYGESSFSPDLDREITLDEISTSFSFFLLTNSLRSHIDLLDTTLSHSTLHATTTVPTFVISSTISKFHVPKSLLAHTFLNLTRYDEIDGGILYPLSKSTELAKKIFSFVELYV